MTSVAQLEQAASRIRAIGIRARGWTVFQPEQVLGKLPDLSQAARADTMSSMLLAFPALSRHWPFLAAAASLQLPLSRDAIRTLLERIDPARMAAGPRDELAPGYPVCVHELVMRAFAGAPDQLRWLTLPSRRIELGVAISRALLGEHLAPAERKRVLPALDDGARPSTVLVWSDALGLHDLPWEMARATYF